MAISPLTTPRPILASDAIGGKVCASLPQLRASSPSPSKALPRRPGPGKPSVAARSATRPEVLLPQPVCLHHLNNLLRLLALEARLQSLRYQRLSRPGRVLPVEAVAVDLELRLSADVDAHLLEQVLVLGEHPPILVEGNLAQALLAATHKHLLELGDLRGRDWHAQALERHLPARVVGRVRRAPRFLRGVVRQLASEAGNAGWVPPVWA